MQKKKVLLKACLVTALAGSASMVIAETAEDAKDYRLAIMTSMRGHVVAASMHVRDLVEDNGFLAAHAEGLANGARELKHVFPPGSNVGESEALPVIWEQPEKFREAVEEAERATLAFKEVVANGDKAAIARAFREVGAACRGCHDRFRVQED